MSKELFVDSHSSARLWAARTAFFLGVVCILVALWAPVAVADESSLWPASLAGTEPDGAARVDAEGAFVADAEARAFFDYFLSARGELPMADLETLVAQELALRLPAAATAEGLEVYQLYVKYQEAARRKLDPALVEKRPEAAYVDLLDLRIQIFGDAREAFFAGATGYEEAALELHRMRLEGASAVDLRQVARKHEGALGGAASEKARGPLALRQEVTALREAGASEVAVQEARAKAFGAEAAERLAALDLERAAWRQRVEDFRSDRSTIWAKTSLSEKAKAAAVEALLESRFSAPERSRVLALDRVEGIESPSVR